MANLHQGDAFQKDFEAKVVGDVGRAVDDHVGGMVNWLVEKTEAQAQYDDIDTRGWCDFDF